MADTQNPTDTSSNDPSNNPEGVIPKLYSLDKDLYTSKGVSLDDFTLAMSNPAVQNKVFNKHIDKFAAKKVTFRDFQSSLNIEPSREKGSLKDYIYQLEHDPKKGYYSFNPDSKSGAVGGYQIIYDNNVEEKNKQKYGVNRDQFLSNPFVQEEYMSDRINDEYIPNLDALKEINKAKGNKYNDYELAYLIHHEGLAGAKHFLKNGKSLHGSEKALESQFAKGRTYLEQLQALSENKIDSNPNQDEDSKLAEYYKANPNTGSKSWFSNAILSTDLFLGDVKKTKTLEDGTEVYLRDGGEKVYKLPDGRVVRSLTDKNNAALKAGKNIVTDTMIGGVIGTAGMLFGAARDIGEKLAYHTTDGKAGDNNWDSVYNNDLSAFAKDMKQSLRINKPDFTPERLQKIDIKEGDDEITKLSKYVSYIAEESGNPDFWYNEGAQGISSMLEMALPSMFVGKLGKIAATKIMKGADKLEDLTKLQKYAIKGTEYISYSAFKGALESAIEAEGVYGKVKSDLYAKNNFFPNAKQLSDDEINRISSERASSAFVDNFALISGSNLLEADNLMGNLGGRSFMGKAAKLLLKAGLQAGVEAFQEVGQFGIEKYETSKLDKKDTKHEGNLFQRLYSGAAETISGVAGTIKDEYDKGSPELAKSAFLGGLLGGGMTSATQLTKEVINYPISKTINETAPESILDFYQKDENGNIKYNDKNEPVIDKSALSTYLSKVDNDYQNIAAKNLANEIDDKLAGDIITAGSFANFIQKHKAKDRSSSRLRDVFDSYALTDEQYNLLGISKRKDKKEYVDERNSMFEIGLRAYDEISSIKQKLTPDSFNKAFEHFYKQKFVFSKIQSNQAKIDNYDAQTQLSDVESANRDNLVKEQERLNGLFTFYGSLVNSSIGKQTKTKDNKDNIGEDTSIPKDKEDFVEDSPKDTSKDTKKTEDLPSTQQEKEDQKDDLSKVEIPVQDPIVDSSKVDFKTEPKPLVTDEEGNFLSPDELDSSSDIDENNGNDNADIKESVVFDDEIKDNNQNDNIPVPTNTTTNPVSSTEVDQQSETQPVNESDVSSEEIPIEPTDDDVSKAIALESSDRKEVLASIPRIKINNSVQPGDVITNKEGVEFVIKSVKGNKVTYTTKTIDDVFNKVNKPHQFVRTTTIPVNAKVSDTVDNTGSVSPISESIETDETLQHSKVYVLNNKESKDSVGSTLAISQLDNSSVIVKRTESINGVVAYIDYISRAVVDRFKKLWNPYFLKHENGDFKGFSIQKSDFPYVAIPNFDISYITDPNGKPINFSRVEDGQYKGLVLLSEVKKYFDNNKFLRVGYGKDETAFDIKYELVDFLPFTTVFSGVDSEIFIRQSSSLTTANTDSSSLREEILQLQQLRRYIQNKIDKGGFVSARITKKDAGIMRLIVPKNTSVASKSSLNKVSPISIYRSSVNNEFDLPILIPNIKNPNRAFIDGTLREVTLIERLGKEVEYYKPSMLYPVDINSDGEVVYNTIYLKNRKLGESNIMGTYGSVPIVNEHSIKNTNNLIYTAELLLSRLYGIDLTIEEKDLLDKLKVKNTIKEVKDYIDSFVRSDLKLISDGVLGSKDSAIHISTMFQLALYNPETKTHQLYTNRPQNQAKGISREAIKATLRDMWFTMNYNHVIGNNTIDVIDEVTKEVLSLNYRELAFDNIYPDYEIFKGDEDSKIGHTIYSPSVNSRIHFEVNGFEYKPETIATTTIPIQVQYPVKIESTVVENDFSNIPDQKVDAQADININSIEAKKTDIERRRQEELDNVQPIYHHTQVKYEDFNFSSFQRGKASISQFGDGLNASTDTTSFLVNRYGKPIQGEVNIKDFIEIDANKSEKELYEYLKAKGYNFSKPASEYKSNEKANEQPAIIELFQDFQKSNPKVKGVKVNNHIIGGQKVSPFYVIYDNKSFYGQDSLKNKINSEYDAELKALEQTTTSNQSKIEAKKADIERRRQEELIANIYAQLGDKTVSRNVILKSVYQQAGINFAKSIGGIFSLRVNNSNKHFGNPFSSVPSEIAKGLIATKSTKESVEKYIGWVLFSNEERAKWIREQIKSGNLKNKPIIYYKELGEPSHATALDYLINAKYDAELKGLEQTTTSNQSDIEVKKADIEQPQATQSELPTDSEFVTERTLDDAENEFPGENPNITSQDITKPTEIQELDLPDNIDDDILAFETEDDYFLNNLTIENSNSIPGVPQVHLNNIVNTLLGRVSRLIENGKLDKEKAKVLEINTMKQLYVNAKASLELTLTKAIPGTKKYEQLKSYLDIVEKVVDNYHIVDSLFNKSFLAITGKDFENNSADNQYNEDRIITLNPKDKTRAAIKLFLLKIKEMDDKNNTKKFFLNSLGIKGAEDLYQHIDVDKALNILFNILTVKTGFYYEPNLENVIKILDDNSKSYPFLTDIAFYLKHTPEIGPEFVRSFYSIDSRYSKLIYTDDIQNGVTYTTLIDNQTNFKSGATKLRNSWKNNLTSLIGFNNVNRLVLDPNSQLGAKLLFIKELFGDSKSRILDYNTGEINLSNTRLSVNQIATIQPWIDSINKTLVNLNNPNVDPRDVLSNKFIYTKKLLINELLKNLGINLDNDVLSKLDNPDYKLLLSNGKSVVFNSNKIFDSRKKLLQNIDQLLIGTSDVNSLLKQDIIREIASFVAQHSKNNNFHSDRMFQDGNKSVAVFQIPRYFYLKVAKLTDLSTGFLETLTSLRNNKKHYSSNPYWKHLIRTNNLNYSTAALQATEEIRRNNSEKDIHEFPEKKLLEAMIANFLSGVNNTTSNVKMKLFGKAISDSKMMTYFEVPKLDLFLGYDSETTYVLSDENNVEITGKTKISDFLIDQILMPDVNRILNDDNVQLKSYNKDVFYSVPALNDFAKYGLNSIKEVASVISNPNTNPTAYNLIENAFKEYLNNEISTTKELFQKYRIGYSSDTKSWSMVSKDAVDYYTERSVAGSDTKIAPETIHNQIVKDFVLNYLVGYSNSSMLIYGDPAIYTKGNINTTMNNVIKRLKTFASPREVLDTNIYKKLSGKDSISYLVVKDDVSPVNSIKYITNLLDGLEITDEEVKILRDKNSSVDDKNIIYNKYPNSSGYFKNNHADAQEFVHWKHHLDTLVALGELKIHDYNNIVDIIENHPEKIKNSDILKVFAPFKPLYSGTVIKGPIEQQFYIKSSHIPLLPGFSGGLEPLILFMEKNTIDRLAFESSVKLGIENTIELFENTKLKNLSDLKKLDIDNATLNLPIENYGKQLHNLIKDKNEITLTTQAQKGIFGNIKNEFVEFKGKRVKVADLEKLRDKLHGEAQEFLKQELIKALDPNDTGEMDIESLLGLMNSELESGRYDDNIKQSISFDKERNVLRVPLWLSSNPGALEAIITNIINSGGVSGIKRPGIGLVQASSIGQTVVSDQLKDFDNNIIFTEKYNPKKGLQHGVKNKKGQYVSQIIVPWYFKEKMDYFVNGKNQVDLSKLPEDLLTIFGFRIPNQFHASMIGLEIVGFLPPSFGNTVLVPTEITSQMGSDFDVDKLYSYIKALDFKVDQEALDLSKKVKKEISDYWKAVSNDFRNQYPDLIARKKEIEESYIGIAKKPDWEQKDIDLHTEIVDVLSTAREYDAKRKELEKELTLLNQKIKESARYELTDDYLNNLWNQILDIELSVITSNNEVIQRSVRQALDTPTEQLSDVADHLQKLQNSTQKQQSHISPIYNIQKYFAGSQAKSLVGNTSLALVFNFIIQNKSFSISNKSYIPVSFDGDFVHKNLSNPFTVKTDNELKQAYEKFKNGVFVEDLINGTQQLYDITEIPSDVLDDYRREKVKQDLAKELSDRTGISVRWVDSIDSLSNNQLGSIKDEVYRELDNYFFDYISGRKMYQRHENLPNYIKINNDAFINNTQKNRIATRLADSIKKNTNGKFVGSLEGTEDSYVIKINTSTSYRRDLNNRYNKDNSKLQSKSLSDIDIFDIEYLERKNIPIKTGVEEVFNSNLELASIGTQEQYSKYLDSIFPDSKVKDVVYHGTQSKDKFNKFERKSELYGFYFTSYEDYSKQYGNNISSIINLVNPKTYDSIDKKEYSKIANLVSKDEFNEYDGINIKNFLGTNEIVVFEPEQIHILGSKQDIEGFKDFKNKLDRLATISNNKIYGYYDKLFNEIVLSKDADQEVIIHEFIHPFMESYKIMNPTQHADLLDEAYTILGQELSDQIVLNYPENQVDNELITRAIAKVANNNVDSQTGKSFLKKMMDFIRYIKDQLHRNVFSKIALGQPLDMKDITELQTIQELADVFSLYKGKLDATPIFTTTSIKPDSLVDSTSTTEQPIVEESTPTEKLDPTTVTNHSGGANGADISTPSTDYKSIPSTTNSIKEENVIKLRGKNPNTKIILINSYSDFIYNLSESMIKEKKLAKNIEYKSSSIIGIQSAAVDDANKNLLDKINFTRDTSLAAIILLQQGLNYNQVFTLLSQPVIKEYVNNLTKKGKGFDYNANLEQISYESAYNQYASNLSEEELENIKSFDFKLSGLEESLRNPDSTNKAHSIRQIKALNVFRHYSTKYNAYIGIMNAANINTTGGGKNLSTMSSVLTSVDDIMGNNTFRNANKVLQEGVHTHSIKNLAELFNFVMKKDNGLSILNHKSNIYDTLYFEISSYLNNRNVPITPWIKNKIFEGIRNVVKAYMFSSLTSSISDKQAEDIRQELLKGNDRKPPLGIILLNLKAKNYKSIANSTFNSKRISDNSFLNIIDIKKEKDSNNTFITADVNDNKLDINEIHKDLEDLFNTRIELENGYNTKHLILDLIKYDFVMGRKQSAKSFTKYLPETLIQKIILNNDLLNNTLDELSLFDSEKINSLTKNVLFYTPELITQIPNITSDSEPTFIHDVDEDQVSLGQMRINYKAVNNDTIISNALFTKLEGSDDVIVNPIIKVYDVIYEYDSTLMKYIKVTGLTNSSYGIGINNDLSSPRRLNIPVTNLSIINATTYSDKEVSTPTGILSSIKRELDRVTHSNEKATTKNNSNILTQVLDYMGALNDYSIEFVDTLENISVGGKERKNLYGYTDVANKRIVIARDLKDRGNLTYSRVLLHEIGHIVTNTYISEYLNQLATGKSDTLTKEQITTLNRVYKVYQRLESDKEFTSQLERPINNFHEFVTEVISSHDFRTKVDKNYKASIFEKINEFIKSILKQVFGETNNYVGYSDTLLGDILSIPTNNNFNTQVYSSKDDPKVYIVKKLGDDVLSVSTFNDAGNPASYVDAQSIYDKIKDYDKRDVKIYEDAYNIKKVSDNVLGEFTITTVNGIVSIKDSNNNTISETDLRHGLILGFETQEESQENSQTGDPKTDTLKFVSSISDNKIRSLDIKYKKLFSIINNRLTNVSKKIKIQEDVIKNIKAKKSISALENNTLLNNNIKKLDALESEFNTLIVSLNKIAELKGVSDLYKFFAQSEGDFVNILSKEEISFAEANYLSSLFNEILSKFNPNSPNYYLDKNEFINLGSSEKKDIIEKLSGFEARLKTTYLEQLLNHKRKMVKDSLNVYSQNRLSDEKFKEIIDSELKDISELQRWFLGADRVDDEFTNMVVNRMQQVAQQGVSQSAEYSNKLKELYQRIIPSLKKYSSPNDKFGIISVLLDNFGNFISDYTEDFFDSQNKMLSDFKQQLTAANGDKFKIRNAFLKRNRWNIQNKVALNPKYLLEEDELKDLGLKFVKSANFEQDKQKYLDYIRSTVGMYKFDRMVESVRRSARDYNEEYNTLKTTLNDQITSGVIDAAQKKEALRTFQAKYSPIIAADYNFNPKLINSVARELGKKDSSELYISDKYVKLVPKKFEGVKSLYETNQGYTKFYDKNIQKFYDNSEYDILDFIDHVNDLLHMGVHLIPEEKRFGISTRSLPFIEKDLLENLISEPISLLGLKNRVKDISASIRSLGAYKTTDQYKELPVDFVSSAAVNDKNQEIKDKINLKIKEYYLSKDILPDEIAKTTDPKLKDSDLYYPTVYKRIKQEVYDEVNKLRSFDIVKGLSMYAQQVYNYKTKAENSDEVGLLIDMVEQRLKNKGVDSINGSIVKDLEHSKHSSAQERIKMFTNFLNNYRELSTNKPTAKFKNVRGKHYSNFEKQQLEELKQYLSKLESINKDKLSDEQKIVIETEIDKIKSNIDELGKDVYLVDSILAPLIVFTQLKGLGWNFVSYINNLSIGQLNNYYESKDGRIFTADSYKDSIKDILKHSSGAKFGFGILGMIAGGAVSPLMLPGLMVGFTSGIAIGKLTQKYYETSDKDGKIDVDKIFNFYAKHDVLNKVQNENYRTFTDSSPVVSQKLQKLKDTSLGKFISNYLSIYKSTEAAEDINQGVIGLSYIRSVAIDDINGVNRPLIDFINQDGSINEELLPQRVQLNDVNLSKTEFVNRMVTEIKNTIRRTQGDYESLFKSDIKSKILGKAGMQFKTWMPETIMKDFEVAKKDQGITDILTGEKYTRKGVYMSLLEKAGLFNTSIVFTSNILTPLMLTSLLTGAFIPALALGSGGAAALFYANKKADKSKVDPLVTKALVKSVFNELPFIKRFIGSKEPNKYFSDLLNNEDAGNFRALAAKLKVNIGLLSVYMIFSILKEVVKGDDDDDDKNKMLSKLSYTLLNLAGKTYSDNSLTLDPTSSFDRFSEVKNIIPPITTAVAIGEIVLKPGIWGEQYERDQYKGSPTGYKKGDFKQLVKLEKIIPGPNRVSQLEYMMTNKYRMFDLGN